MAELARALVIVFVALGSIPVCWNIYFFFNIVRTLQISVVHYLIVTSIVCMYSNGGIQSFHGIHMDWSMESIWTGSWNPYGLVHGIHMDWSMESIWTSSWNPYGLVHGIHMEWVIPWPFHDYSIWIPWCLWNEKMAGVSAKSHSIWIPWNGRWIPWIPYAFHME